MVTMVMDEEVKLVVGDGIICEGYLGTVHYIGTLPGTKGIWLGVEWQDVSRGKHNGCHQGTNYYTTSHPTSGSFIRPKKVEKCVTFVAALRERYGLIEDPGAGVVQEDLFVKGQGSQVTTVEVVGAESVNKQQSNFSQLLEMSVHGCRISSAGRDGDIASTCGNIRILDISANFLVSWQNVAEVCKQLPHLSSLNVSENKLSFPSDPSTLSGCFKKLGALFINRMGYTWKQVRQCGLMCPQLEEVHACFNKITDISEASSELQMLRLLNLESNPVTDWASILKFNTLTHLETLILTDTQIEEISFPDCPPGASTEYFKNLKINILYNNKITKWESLNELNKLLSVQDLKIKHNPVVTATEDLTMDTIWFILVAKIAGLKFCNRTRVSAGDKRGAELDYLKMFGIVWRKSGGDQDPVKNNPSAEFRNQHPRYQELIEKYGAPSDAELVKKTSALKNSLLTLNIECPQMSTRPAISKKLPASMTVQKLKALMLRLYRDADPTTLKILYTAPKMPDQEIELDNDLREITFYGIREGDTLIMKW